MKGKLKQRILAAILCIAMIVTSINLTNLFNTNLNAATGGNLSQKRTQAANEALNNFKFKSTNLPKWDGTYTACYNSSTNTFTVDSPSDFAYALRYAPSYQSCTINILTDIDMNGINFTYNGAWYYVTLNGNGHTIYNYTCTNSMAGLCTTAFRCNMNNITFEYAKLHATTLSAGMFPWTYTECTSSTGGIANASIYTNCHMNNSLCYSDSQYHVGSLGGFGPVKMYNCSSTNNSNIGNYHVGSIFGLYEPA